MEYIKKEDLIKGEIYTHQNGNIVKYEFLNLDNQVCGKHIGQNKTRFCSDMIKHQGLFKIKELRLATPEEKYWLKTCIEQDKFITFEEAMKSFIPEYVECVLPEIWKQTIKENSGNLIFKSNFKSSCVLQIKDKLLDKTQSSFKPSTKEAYHAQFVVKEPEFVLPEKWGILRNIDNDKVITEYINSIASQKHCYLNENKNNLYLHNKTNGVCSHNKILYDFTEITFEQFKKYVLKEETIQEKVIEPLPQFKVIETIETITKVENNEGSQFFIGDKVISSNGKVQTIESFDYNKAKTNIIAFTNKQSISGNGIGIDKIEHYINTSGEPGMIFIPEETLLEKAKRLYPVGTRFKAARGNGIRSNYEVTYYSEFKENIDGAICIQNNGNGTIYFNGVWGEIIE